MEEGTNQPTPGAPNSRPCALYQEWMSAYLDGELDADRRRQLESHVLECTACRREYDCMKRLVLGTSSAFAIEEPPAEAWDDFLDGVCNRLERKTGWIFLAAGGAALTAYGVFLFFTEPWGSLIIKIAVAAPVLGVLLLFISVWRQRLRAAQTDRYSKEVYR